MVQGVNSVSRKAFGLRSSSSVGAWSYASTHISGCLVVRGSTPHVLPAGLPEATGTGATSPLPCCRLGLISSFAHSGSDADREFTFFVRDRSRGRSVVRLYVVVGLLVLDPVRVPLETPVRGDAVSQRGNVLRRCLVREQSGMPLTISRTTLASSSKRRAITGSWPGRRRGRPRTRRSPRTRRGGWRPSRGGAGSTERCSRPRGSR